MMANDRSEQLPTEPLGQKVAWTAFCDNPDAFLSYYYAIPSLDRFEFEVSDLSLMNYSPSLRIYGALRSPPDRYCDEHCDQPSSVNVTICLLNLTAIEIQGVPTQEHGFLSFASGIKSRIAFSFRSQSIKCCGEADSMLIEQISVPKVATINERGPRLFSHLNVWNSCLLLAQMKGFALKLTGYPDDKRSISGCIWRATREDGTELTASNPIELAGLISLHEHHQPNKDRPYWWQIEGQNLLDELHKKWAATYFGREDTPREQA